MDTIYSNASISDSPCYFIVLLPTWECNACTEYEFALMEQEVDESNDIDSNRDRILTLTKQFLELHLEIILIVFWIFLIALFLMSIALVIYLLFLGYKVLKGFIPK